MRARGGILPALAALLVAAGPAQAASHAATAARATPKPCAVRGSTTVARNAQVRVYARTARESDDHTLVGCLLGSGRRLALDAWFSCGCSRGDESEPQVWLRDTVVAVNRSSCAPDPFAGGCAGSVRTVDRRTRRTLRRANTGGPVGELAIGPSGLIAVVTARGLVASDAEGERVLDPATQVAALAFAGGLLYWTSGDQPRSALLRP